MSFSTVSRIENGKMPDMGTFLHLCNWLDVLPDDFIKVMPIPQELEKSTLAQITLLLRMDMTLDVEVVDALIVLLHRLVKAQGKITQ